MYIVIPAVRCQYHGLTDVFVVFAAKCISWNIFSVLCAAAQQHELKKFNFGIP